MFFFLVLVSIATFGGIAYLAVSPQSNFKIRIAALGALALMVTTIIINLIRFYKSSGTPKQRLLPDMDPSDLPPVSTEHNLPMAIMLVLFLIALFAMIAIVSMREHKKGGEKDNLVIKDDSFPDNW
jgi:membrane protein YdbS with pleckstrin-like domain